MRATIGRISNAGGAGGPPADAHSTYAYRAMSSRSHGVLERDCSDHATDQTTNVPTGCHDDTSDSPRSSTPAGTASTCTADTRVNCRWLRDTTPPKTKKPRQSEHRAAARHAPQQTPADENTADDAAKDLHRHQRVFRDMSQVAQRAAFYAGIWKDGRFTVPLRDAVLYKDNFVAAQAVEHERLQQGHLPRKLTLQIVAELAAQAASSSD